VLAQAISEGRTIHVEDLLDDSTPPVSRRVAIALGYRTLLCVPMLRDGVSIGAISVARQEARPFSDRQIELVQTFADQAVIAIENVRLFNETKETLEQQTATGEILRVIASSPTDVQPVFNAIAESARRLCDADFCNVARYDNGLIHLSAHAHSAPELVDALRRMFPMPPTRATTFGRTIIEGGLVYIRDIREDPEYSPTLAEAHRSRCGVGVPMLRDAQPIGAIVVGGREPQKFSDSQLALLQTFADQAVIAIENVRLFKELEARNRDLTEALDQQTATAEVLKVISRSTFDLQPVLDTLIENAARLCGAPRGAIFRGDGDLYHGVAFYNASPELVDFVRCHPVTPGRYSITARTALERRTIHVADIQADADYSYVRDVDPVRTELGVPMFRGDDLLGIIILWKFVVQPFSDKQIELVETFADQAVIAIENVRLFKELEARTQDLTRSVGELRALGEVGQAVSSTLDLETVLATIVSRAVQLSGSDQGIVYEFDEGSQIFHARATHRITAEHLQTVRAVPIRLGEGAIGRAGVIREPVQVADVQDESQPVASQVRELLVHEGMRALLAVPLIREQRLLGGLVILRREQGAFSTEVVSILQTFATQSVLAIQNARLFRELADKSRQLEVASLHKSEFLANMSHELRTPQNAIIGFSEVLTDRMFGELNEKQEEYLKDIYTSGTHLLSLINDILDLSKIEAGRMELELTEFDLPTAIENALMLVRERAGRRSIALHTNIDTRLGQIQADERKVRQVVLNLLSNAIKFTPEGGRIEVVAVPKDGLVEVSVSDTGIGIAPEDQEKVFEEFRQVGTAAKKVEGTGLGLTLCRKFVELHGGRIWVQSQEGVGSTFMFTIPVRHGE
jgi:signal transduction histidine kinase